MAAAPFFRYALPSAVLGLVLGYAGAVLLGAGASAKGDKKLSPRETFLSSEDDDVDYDKLARVCVEAARRTGPRTGGNVRSDAGQADANPDEYGAKDELDRIMTISLEKGIWSRGAAFRADDYLQMLPPSDVADFERLLRTAIERGDLTLQDGAWLPGEGN